MGCNKSGSYFCRECVSDILQKELVCPICERSALGGETHPFCKGKYTLDGLWSLGIYRGPLKRAIKSLKYYGVRDLAATLTEIIIKYWAKYQPFIFDVIKESNGAGWAIVPVPLHWFRENRRGFNQSSLIGQLLSKKLGLGYSDALKRIRLTKPQVKSKGQMRYKNIKDAFVVTAHCNLITVPYILLIDDVWTTGSTIRECCLVLKKAGAKQVWALTLAR